MKTEINVVHLDKNGKQIPKEELETHIRETIAQVIRARIRQETGWEG